jgi:hypothetical protein
LERGTDASRRIDITSQEVGAAHAHKPRPLTVNNPVTCPPTYQVKVPPPGYSTAAVAAILDFSKPAFIFSLRR